MSMNGSLKSSASLQGPRQNPSVSLQGRKQSRSSQKTRHSRSSNSVPQAVHQSTNQDRNTFAKAPAECDCGPFLYGRVLGHTADETVLQGLQTVIDLCNKLRVCGNEDEVEIDEPERDEEYDFPERDTVPEAQIQTDPADVKGSRSQTDPRDVKVSKSQTDSTNVKGSISQTDPQKIKSSISQTSHSRVSAGFQVNPSVTQAETQTAPYPEMISEILQTMGLDAELASKIIQTSFMSIGPVKSSSTQDERTSMELASILMQTSNPSLHSQALQTASDLRPGSSQTFSKTLPAIIESTTPLPYKSASGTQSDSITSADKQTLVDTSSCRSIRGSLKPSSDSGFGRKSAFQVEQSIIADEQKCISPPEPPTKVKTCKCCKCSSSSQLHRKPENGKNKKCICYRKISKCRCSTSRSSISSSIPGDREDPQEVKYAVTRISKYNEFTTFEVMRSTRNVPKQMPKSVEGVFVLKKQRDKDKSKDQNSDVKNKIKNNSNSIQAE